MRIWHGLVLWLLLTALLRLTVGNADVLTAPEVDALDAGVRLAEALTQDAEVGPRDRLVAGFEVAPEQARAALLPKEHGWRRAVAEAPVPKWLAAVSVMLAPTAAEATNATRAATGAAAALALAAVVLWAGLWRRDRVVAVVAAGGLLLQPGALVAAGAAGYGAAAALTMALLVAATARLTGPARAGGLAVGLALGLALGVHPTAAYLIIAVFVAFAIARAGDASPPEAGQGCPRGELALPSAPMTLFAVPVVAVLTLVALWPPTWEDTGRHLGAWLIDNGWIFNPPYDVAGVVYDQATDRAAMGWAALAQWAGWHAVPLTVAFVAGVARAARRGRDALWFPLLAWVTLMLGGAADGGLFGGRLSLMPMLWVPSAIVCAQGVRELSAWLARAWPSRASIAAPLTIAALLAPAVITTAVGAPPAPWAGTGASLLRPVPVGLLRAIARDTPDALVHLGPHPDQLRPALDVARDHLELPLRWADAKAAQWVVSIGGPQPPPADAREVRSEGSVLGLPIVVQGPRTDL